MLQKEDLLICSWLWGLKKNSETEQTPVGLVGAVLRMRKPEWMAAPRPSIHPEDPNTTLGPWAELIQRIPSLSLDQQCPSLSPKCIALQIMPSLFSSRCVCWCIFIYLLPPGCGLDYRSVLQFANCSLRTAPKWARLPRRRAWQPPRGRRIRERRTSAVAAAFPPLLFPRFKNKPWSLLQY